MPSEVNSQTVRAGTYARYSSDHQRDASIDDQVRICRAEVERQGCPGTGPDIPAVGSG